MEITNLYIKKFSEIRGMQEKQTIYYNLCSEKVDDRPVYGINIFSEDDRDEQKTYLISESIEMTKLFIKYVYENAVGIDVIEDVVNDFLCIKQGFVNVP